MSDGGSLLRLLISCPDRPGIVAGVSRFLFEAGANIVRSDLGADVERLVLARAVQAHCEDRVLRHGNTTVVF